MKIVILGNAGSGKTTLARQLVAGTDAAHLCLDDIACDEGTQRKPLEESRALLERFITRHERWVVEGCYNDLIEAALPHADQLHWLNPGTEVCVANCRRRPWEPDKFPTPQAQQAALDTLIQWVRRYPDRDDEFGLTRHQAIFNAFPGPKQEHRQLRFQNAAPGTST